MVRADTSQRILDTAERLVQTRGFNGFSYADIATTLGVTKASLHYHFPAKAELGHRLIERYEKNFLAALETIDQTSTTAREKLKRYAQIYADVLRNNRMCLCGMLAAEYAKKAEGNGGRGSISIVGFYARRARRILPAALTVIMAVVIAGVILLGVKIRQEERLLLAIFPGEYHAYREHVPQLVPGLDLVRRRG